MVAYAVIIDGIGDDYDASPFARHEIGKAVSHQLGANALSVRSEVHWHLYVECLDRAWYFMPNSAKHFDPGFTLKPAQQDYIVRIREFRNHLAHRDKAIADIESLDRRSMSRSRGDSYEVGYKRDNRNRIEFSPVSGDFKGRTLKMPMNQEGFQQFKNIITYTDERLKQSALDRLARHFTDHPDTMPAVSQVGALSQDGVEPVED